MAKRPHLFHLYQHVDELAELFEETQGEITPETEALEARVFADEAAALEQLAGFLQHCAHGEAACKAEAKRIAEAKARIARAEAWAKKHVRRILGDRKSATAGSFKISTRKGSLSVNLPDDLDGFAVSLIDESAATMTETYKIDKVRLRKLLEEGGDKAEHLSGMGVELVQGERSVSVK